LCWSKELLISHERFEGYKSALQEYGLSFDPDLVYHIGFRKNEAVDALNQWLSLESPPDAIFAVHHGNAIELMVELKKRGIKIPAQIAVAGFGDDQIAELIEPALTVFHQFPLQVGEIAANTLINNIIDGDNFVPEDIIVQGKLVLRKSSLKI
jgi:LacI family transcriptional regulator